MVNVALLRTSDSTILTGTSSNREGRFSIPGLPQGLYFLRYSMLEFKDRLTLTATVADVFSSMNRKNEMRTTWVDQDTFNNRESRIAFIGLTYHFGMPSNQRKDKALQYDDNG